MITYSNNKPEVFESIGDGGFRYNYHIEAIEVDNFIDIDNEEDSTITKRTQWKYDNILVYPPITKDKITKEVITNTWNINYEQKLVNDYNAALLGIFSEEETKAKVDAYTNFLIERKHIKEMISRDWEIIKELI